MMHMMLIGLLIVLLPLLRLILMLLLVLLFQMRPMMIMMMMVLMVLVLLVMVVLVLLLLLLMLLVLVIPGMIVTIHITTKSRSRTYPPRKREAPANGKHINHLPTVQSARSTVVFRILFHVDQPTSRRGFTVSIPTSFVPFDEWLDQKNYCLSKTKRDRSETLLFFLEIYVTREVHKSPKKH